MTVAVQKFRVGDVVKEASAFGMDKDTFSRRTGIIKECKKIKNKAGSAHYHYEVLWNGHSCTTLRAQHRLTIKEGN